MSKNRNEWTQKVMTLIRGGNLEAAAAQIKVAPTVGDLTRLQTAFRAAGLQDRHRLLDVVIVEQLALLSAPRLHRAP